MRSAIKILFTGLLIVATGCGRGSTRNNSGVVQLVSHTPRPADMNNAEALYESLPAVALPWQYDTDEEGRPAGFAFVGEHFLFPGMPASGNGYAASIPRKGVLSFVLTADGTGRVTLHSLSDDYEPLDTLPLYSSETVPGGTVRRSSVVYGDHSVRVSKHLGGTLIEQLTYMPSLEGIFEEVRDGRTPAVAYNSYDGRTYIVESFTWDHDADGRLIQKEHKTQNYMLGADGKLSLSEGRTEEGAIGSRLLKEEYAAPPQKVTLRILNDTDSTIEFGANYTVEKLSGGKWTEQKFPEGIAFIAVMYLLEPGRSDDYDIYLYPDRMEYSPGSYRIHKKIFTQGGQRDLYAPFRITGRE